MWVSWRQPSIMASKAAAAFDRTTHTPTALKKFWAEDPLTAAKWTVGVAKAAGVESKVVAKVEKALLGDGTDEAKSKKLAKLIADEPALLKLTDAKAMAGAAA